MSTTNNFTVRRSVQLKPLANRSPVVREDNRQSYSVYSVMHVFKTLSLLSKPYASSVVLAERKWIRWGEILKVVSSARPIVHERVLTKN